MLEEAHRQSLDRSVLTDDILLYLIGQLARAAVGQYGCGSHIAAPDALGRTFKVILIESHSNSQIKTALPDALIAAGARQV